MTPSPLIGVGLHWLGGLASASFYVPFRGVRGWSWEIFWLTGGIFSWLLAPWFFAAVATRDLVHVLAATPPGVSGLCVLFGVLWGFGGLTYGLTMRYLGLSLGMAVVLGLCTVFGTLIPPLVSGDFATRLLAPRSGRIVLSGLAITILGIALVAYAGIRKDGGLTAVEKAEAVQEFDFPRGLAVAVFSGVMSACFAFGLAAGKPIRVLSQAAGTSSLWSGLPVLCLVMFGGLLTNGIWCIWLIWRRASAGEWVGAHAPAASTPPLLRNYLLCALAGTAWYFQFFFYTMGESQMGRFGFSSWTLHMASIIIFGTLWGFALREWKGAGTAVRRLVWQGVGLLIVSTLVIGLGNRLAT